MFDDEVETKREIDMGEIYRQNYIDAREEVAKLEMKVAELQFENEILNHELDLAENLIVKK